MSRIPFKMLQSGQTVKSMWRVGYVIRGPTQSSIPWSRFSGGEVLDGGMPGSNEPHKVETQMEVAPFGSTLAQWRPLDCVRETRFTWTILEIGLGIFFFLPLVQLFLSHRVFLPFILIVASLFFSLSCEQLTVTSVTNSVLSTTDVLFLLLIQWSRSPELQSIWKLVQPWRPKWFVCARAHGNPGSDVPHMSVCSENQPMYWHSCEETLMFLVVECKAKNDYQVADEGVSNVQRCERLQLGQTCFFCDATFAVVPRHFVGLLQACAAQFT